MTKTQRLGIADDGKVYKLTGDRCRLLGQINHVAVLKSSEGRRRTMIRFEPKVCVRGARGKKNVADENANSHKFPRHS